MADDFKAHSPKAGPKLGASQAAGMTGLARRVALARDRVRDEELARRSGAFERLGDAAGRVEAGLHARLLDEEASPPAFGLTTPGEVARGGEAAGADRGEPTSTLDRSAGRPAPAVGDGSIGGVRQEAGFVSERSGAEQGTKKDKRGVKRTSRPSPAKSGPKGGRPRKIVGEPWVAEGVTRRTWERRRKAGDG